MLSHIVIVMPYAPSLTLASAATSLGTSEWMVLVALDRGHGLECLLGGRNAHGR